MDKRYIKEAIRDADRRLKAEKKTASADNKELIADQRAYLKRIETYYKRCVIDEHEALRGIVSVWQIIKAL